MDLERRFGQTVQSIKGNGDTIKRMERENFGTLTETYSKADGYKIKQMDGAHTIM